MNILVLSWRDIKHPYGGGAEDLAHQIAKRWVKDGHEVSHFSALFPGAKEEEVLDGVLYIRRGTWYSVHLWAALYNILGRLPKHDVIVDEVHGYSFFSVLYSRSPVVCLACEVAKDIWDQMFKFPLNLIGKTLEKMYFLTYRNVPFLTISPSAKEELVQSGIPGKNITVLPMGFSYTLPKSLPAKEKDPTIIFLGRLVKTKGIEDAIAAFVSVAKELPKAKMWIVGKGEGTYVAGLKRKVKDAKLEKKVHFKGFVAEEEKFRLLARAHLILAPSTHEGWGLIVPEANIVGTPAVVYDVPGLRDVTKNGINGIVVRENSPENLAEESVRLLKNVNKYKKLVLTSKEYAKSMTWDKTAFFAMSVLKKVTK